MSYQYNIEIGKSNAEWAADHAGSSRFDEELDSERLAYVVQMYDDMHKLNAQPGKNSNQHIVAMLDQVGNNNEALKLVQDFVEQQYHAHTNPEIESYFTHQGEETRQAIAEQFTGIDIQPEADEFISAPPEYDVSYAPRDAEKAIVEYKDIKYSREHIKEITDRLKQRLEVENARFETKEAILDGSRDRLQAARERLGNMVNDINESRNQPGQNQEANDFDIAALNDSIQRLKDHNQEQKVTQERKHQVAVYWNSEPGKKAERSITTKAAWAAHKMDCYVNDVKPTRPTQKDFDVAKQSMTWLKDQESRALGVKAKAVARAAEQVAVNAGVQVPHHATLKAWEANKKKEAQAAKTKRNTQEKKKEDEAKVKAEDRIKEAMDKPSVWGKWKQKLADVKQARKERRQEKEEAKQAKIADDAETKRIQEEDVWAVMEANVAEADKERRAEAVKRQDEEKRQQNTPSARKERELKRQEGRFNQLEAMHKPHFEKHHKEMQEQGLTPGEYMRLYSEEIIKDYEDTFNVTAVFNDKGELTVFDNAEYDERGENNKTNDNDTQPK